VGTDHENTTKGERAKKSEKRIEESGGNVRGFWLNCDRKEQPTIEELEGVDHKWSFWEGLEVED
jgi:hypothetical protein